MGQGKKRLGVILVMLIAAAAVAGIFIAQAHRETGGQVLIYQDGELRDTFPLSQDRTVTYTGENGGTNTVVIADGKVRMAQASCPDQICVRHAPTDQTADPIVCLPNKLVVEVSGPEGSDQLDSVS